MRTNGQVILLTDPLTTLIHLGSVCFDSSAVRTQTNVFLYYDSISRASAIFSRLCGFPWACPPRDQLPSAQGEPSQQGTRLDDPLVFWRGRTLEIRSE